MSTCVSRSLLSTTPSLTIATTRSSSSPWVASSRVWAQARPCSARAASASIVHSRTGEIATCRMIFRFPSPDALQRPLGLDNRCRGRCVAADLLGQEGIRRRSDTGEAGEFQLQPHPGGRARIGIVAVHVAARPQPHPPAAGTVLKADETLNFLPMRLLGVAQRVDLLGEHLPAALDGERRGELDLVV